jgi:hypothetical protein
MSGHKTVCRVTDADGSKRQRVATGTVCPLEAGSLLFGKSAQPPSPSPLLSRETTPMMPKDLKELLRAFIDHGVKYLIVGGYAYGVHAEPLAHERSRHLHPVRRSKQPSGIPRARPIRCASGA